MPSKYRRQREYQALLKIDEKLAKERYSRLLGHIHSLISLSYYPDQVIELLSVETVTDLLLRLRGELVRQPRNWRVRLTRLDFEADEIIARGLVPGVPGRSTN